MRSTAFVLLLFLASTAFPSLAADDWHTSLYRAGGGWWPQRIAVRIENRGASALAGWPVALTLGDQPGQLRLEGTPADSIRVCDQHGNEMLWSLSDADGNEVKTGRTPRAGSLVLPVECPPGEPVRYFVYFGNPSAGCVPEFLEARTELVNGDLETGSGDAPAGWMHDPGDAQS